MVVFIYLSFHYSFIYLTILTKCLQCHFSFTDIFFSWFFFPWNVIFRFAANTNCYCARNKVLISPWPQLEQEKSSHFYWFWLHHKSAVMEFSNVWYNFMLDVGIIRLSSLSQRAQGLLSWFQEFRECSSFLSERKTNSTCCAFLQRVQCSFKAFRCVSDWITSCFPHQFLVDVLIYSMSSFLLETMAFAVRN